MKKFFSKFFLVALRMLLLLVALKAAPALAQVGTNAPGTASNVVETAPAAPVVERSAGRALEARVSSLEHKVRGYGSQGMLAFLTGTFCALWAQNTRRSAWLWFFMGLIFNFITLLVLLYKNSQDPQRQGGVH